MNTKYCPKCSTEKSTDDFYKRPERPGGFYGYCKICFNKENDKRRIALKDKAIIYKGSSCVRCGLKFPEAPQFLFDFHHIDPSTKNKEWTSIRKHGWKRIKEEIDKCVLVCSNCHRYIEYGSDERFAVNNGGTGGT